jgi:hypothetical protein
VKTDDFRHTSCGHFAPFRRIDMKVPIERYVKQVHDGTHYCGYVKIANTRLEYELVFTVPIPKLDDLGPAKNKDEVRGIFQITMKRGDLNIELTDDEYCFFFELLAEFALDFYDDPQTRRSNDGRLGQMLHGQGPLAALGGSITISITDGGTLELPPELWAVLSSEKFGCTLVA